MAVTLEDVEKRLTIVEQELAKWRMAYAQPSATRGARTLLMDGQQSAQWEAEWDAVMEKLGISGEPIGAGKLRAMIEAEGVNPEDNEFSRGIIEMREE